MHYSMHSAPTCGLRQSQAPCQPAAGTARPAVVCRGQVSPQWLPRPSLCDNSLASDRQTRSALQRSGGHQRIPQDLQPRRQPTCVVRASGNAPSDLQQQDSQLSSAVGGGPGSEPGAIGDYRPGDLLGGRYRVQATLGRGSTGVTYRAEAPDGKSVAVKALSLSGLSDWKQLQLFEREAATLRGLSHPGIPAYLDYFEEDTAKDKGFFLVQELAEGRTLAALVRDGWRVDEAEARRITLELLQVLDYLGSRRPPVTHRDVKPENIVLEGGAAGGRVFLVDFGGVQAAAAAGAAEGGSGGTTVIGTYGYMAPEQFRGASEPASDLYALGGTLLFLLSGQPPSAFPQRGLRLDYGEGLVRDPELAAVLGGLLQPLTEDRMRTREAMGLLQGKLQAGRGRSGGEMRRGTGLQGRAQQPAGGRAVLKRQGLNLEVEVPPAGVTGETVYSGAFAVAWNVFVGLWTVGAVAGGGVLFALFSVPFWAAGFMLGKTAIGSSLIRERLQVGANQWNLNQQLAFLGDEGAQWGGRGRKSISGATAVHPLDLSVEDLGRARVVTSALVNGVPQTHVELAEGVRKHVLAEALSTVEQQWLAAQINEHIEEAQRRMGAVRELFDEPAPPEELPARPAGAAAEAAGWGWSPTDAIADASFMDDEAWRLDDTEADSWPAEENEHDELT